MNIKETIEKIDIILDKYDSTVTEKEDREIVIDFIRVLENRLRDKL
jgi:hypothetical protein